MNVVAQMTLQALAEQGVSRLPRYRKALVAACNATSPPFGEARYGDLYNRLAREPRWVALSLLGAARSEGEGSTHLMDMAASTDDPVIAARMREHSIDESRHSRGYVTLFGLIFPGSTDEEITAELTKLSPGYTDKSPFVATEGSPYAYSASVDELIQMNIAEIRTRFYHLLQRPVLLAYCPRQTRERVRRILDSLLVDETRHIAYTARLIDHIARESGIDGVMDLMLERVTDFNEITEDEIGRRSFAAA